jgi:hypothetical protein
VLKPNREVSVDSRRRELDSHPNEKRMNSQSVLVPPGTGENFVTFIAFSALLIFLEFRS